MRTLPKMRFVLSSIALTAALLFPLQADQSFRPGAPDRYAHQSSGEITVGAQAFASLSMTKPVFGKKADLVRFGILPVLLVIENDRKQSVDLQELQVRLETSDGHHLIALDPKDVPFIAIAPERPPVGQSPLSRKKRNPLDVPAITDWAFSAKMLPAGQKASGFFYFQAQIEQGMRIYVSGIVERPSGTQVLYFEIPF